MGDGRREAQMLKVERSRDSLYFRKSTGYASDGGGPEDTQRCNDIVCSIFPQTWCKTKQGLPCSLSSSQAISECNSQREEAVQHVEDMFPEMKWGGVYGFLRASMIKHHLMIMISRSMSFVSHATRSHIAHIQLGQMTRDKVQR